jgi:hypothetical protein
VERDDDTSIQQTNKIKRRFEDDSSSPLNVDKKVHRNTGPATCNRFYYISCYQVIQDSGSNDKGDGTGSSCSDDEHVHVTPLHYANHPFASISRALQENVITHFFDEKSGNDRSNNRQRL